MLLLVASVVALLVGPALSRVAGQRRAPLAMVDGFIIAALLDIVGLEVLPEALEHGGVAAVAAAIVGVALPRLLEGRLHVAEGQLHGAVTWGAVLAYSLHATLDGAALVGSSSTVGALGLGVVLHRVPVGVTMWWLVRPRHGVRGAATAVAVIGAATALGYFGAGRLVTALPLATIGTFQALVGGSLLHVVAGHGHGDDVAPDHPRWSAVGALLGLASLAMVVHAEGGAHSHGTLAILSFAQTAAPWTFAAALLLAFAPRAFSLLAALRRRFGPWLGPLHVGPLLLSFGLFGSRWAALRFALAVSAVVVTSRIGHKSAPDDDAEESSASRGLTSIGEGFAGQLMLGAVCAGLVHAGLGEVSLPHPAWAFVAGAAAWAVPLSGVAAGMAAFALQPVAPAAALVLSIVAPLGTRAVMRRAELRVGARATLIAVSIGALTTTLLGALVATLMPTWLAPVEGAPVLGRELASVGAFCMGAALVLLALKLFRAGPRAIVAAVVEPDAATPHAHEHEHGHEHAH